MLAREGCIFLLLALSPRNCLSALTLFQIFHKKIYCIPLSSTLPAFLCTNILCKLKQNNRAVSMHLFIVILNTKSHESVRIKITKNLVIGLIFNVLYTYLLFAILFFVLSDYLDTFPGYLYTDPSRRLCQTPQIETFEVLPHIF